MEICGMDMKEAYELYTDCGYSFEVALMLFRRLSIPNLVQCRNLSDLQILILLMETETWSMYLKCLKKMSDLNSMEWILSLMKTTLK